MANILRVLLAGRRRLPAKVQNNNRITSNGTPPVRISRGIHLYPPSGGIVKMPKSRSLWGHRFRWLDIHIINITKLLLARPLYVRVHREHSSRTIILRAPGQPFPTFSICPGAGPTRQAQTIAKSFIKFHISHRSCPPNEQPQNLACQ